MLNKKEQQKFDTIEKVVKGLITRKEASIELKLSLKQIDRLKRIYVEQREKGFIYKDRGKKNPNKKK